MTQSDDRCPQLLLRGYIFHHHHNINPNSDEPELQHHSTRATPINPTTLSTTNASSSSRRASLAMAPPPPPPPSVTIQPVELGDVAAIAELCGASFEEDRNTQIKALGKHPFDMRAYTLDSLPGLLKNPRCVVLKAVDAASGTVMGYCNWGFRGFSPEEMPVVEGRVQPPADPPAPPKKEEEEEEEKPPEKAKAASSSSPQQDQDEAADADPIKRLEALTGGDMAAWMEEVMPPGTRCLYVVGLSVAPAFQGRGAGSALLRWGTRVCDDRGVFAWVHSSEPAWPMYERRGFRTTRSLDVDLDEYSPGPPPGEGPGARWGHYVFRYMKYLPEKEKSER